MKISEIKALAKENLKFQWGNSLLTVLILVVLMSCSSAIPVIGSMLVAGPLMVGYYLCFYHASQKEIIDHWDIFKPFETCFGESLLMFILTTLFTFLWSLLFIIPGIIKSFSYSMAPYLMARNPELGGFDAIEKSKEYMKGNKGKLFLMLLSFIGWDILTILTLGLLAVYVAPYKMHARTVFYNDVYEKHNAEIAAKEYMAQFGSYAAAPDTEAHVESEAAAEAYQESVANDEVIDAEFREENPEEKSEE